MAATEFDLEIVAQAVRLVRAAPPRTRGQAIFNQLAQDFPEADPTEIKRNLTHAADLLLKQHYD